jgi:hypothetical protein
MHLRKPSFHQTDSSPSWTHTSDSLPNFGVNSCDLLYFLDCYSRYHQIAIKEEDQEKTAFITPFGAYCYTTMSFWLKKHRCHISTSYP